MKTQRELKLSRLDDCAKKLKALMERITRLKNEYITIKEELS